MLKFYHHPLSPLARRVWLVLLEKNLDFEPIIVNLSEGEQLQPKFLKLNPFHHVPVIVDDGFRVIESLAILDYLEQKYPEITLLPQAPKVLAKVRMAQMVTNSELDSQIIPLILEEPNSTQRSPARRQLKRICQFLTELLADKPYFGEEQFTLGDVVAGNGLILANRLGFSLDAFPQLENYCDRLMAREPWQQVQPSKEQLASWQKILKNLISKRNQ